MRKRDFEMLALGAALSPAPAPRTEYVTRTVHEHRAPTDESIRLAREYEEKAWQAVSNRVLEAVPEIDAQVVVVEKMLDTLESLLLFKVNGKPVRVRFPESVDRHARVRVIAENITEEIMRQL